MKKKFRKIFTIFDYENWLWKSDFLAFWQPMWTSVKVKSKNYFHFTDFFANIYSLLTHVRKTPPLRSHYHFYWTIIIRHLWNLGLRALILRHFECDQWKVLLLPYSAAKRNRFSVRRRALKLKAKHYGQNFKIQPIN